MVRFLLRLTLIWLVALCFSGLFAQEKQVDNRIWSQVYWRQMLKEGLVAPNPPQAAPAAVYTGSGINASLILTDDSPDVPVTTATNTTQSENSIFANPLDPSKAFNSNNSTTNPVTTLFGANYFMTDDFGQTWGGSVNGAGGTNSGDPATAINLSGRYFVGYISNPGGNGVSYSDDEGQTWVRRTVGPNPGSLADKNHFWVDNSPTSPYQGNLCSAWTDFGGVNDNQVVVSVSTDSGDTWTTRTPVSNGLPGFKQGVHIQTGPDGTVYVTYTVYLSGGVQDEPAYGQTRSTDGGVTWEPAQLIITGTRGIRSSGTSKNMRSNSFPCSAVDISDSPRRGWVYMVWANIGVPGTNNGPGIDVYMIRSEDQGATWSSPIRVNQDPTGLGKEHFLPWITCDPVTGVLAVIYLDDRNVASNQCEVYVSTSLDGGDTWEDVKVSDVAFTPAPIPGLAGGYFGDYISISARGGFAYPCWTDNRQGFAMAYVSPILIADPEKPEDPEELGAYSDYQTPDGMRLTWVDPTAYQLGDTLLASDLRIIISRDGVAIDSVDGGVERYDDAGLV
ncbi:MAG TPA: sialidase family protein, partial [Calditrichia bacterium]|nr:sialidase family protein [Calditrichia bacterium]